MKRHVENDFVLPALFVLYKHIEGAPTNKIKDEIGHFISLYEDDLTPYQSRNKNEPRYYQIVGNMISHKNRKLFRYVDRIKEEIDGKTKYILILNDEGKNYISKLIGSINYQENNLKINIDKFDKKIIDYASENKIEKFNSDSRLAKEIIEISNYKCQYAILTNKKHTMFNTKDGKFYAEAHHLIPMKASKDFFPKNLDRASNLVCLCPNCHAILHHGSKEEKRKILLPLYNNYIDILNDEGIFISFEKLLEKYY